MDDMDAIAEARHGKKLKDGLRKSIGSFVVVGLMTGQQIGGAKLEAVFDDGICIRSPEGTKLFFSDRVLMFVQDTGAIAVVNKMPPGGPTGVVGSA